MVTPLHDRHRRNLLQIFSATLAAVHGRSCVREFLQAKPMAGDVYLAALGKAAEAMAAGAVDALGERIVRGLVVCKTGHKSHDCDHINGLEVMAAGHPLPNEASLAAGEALLEFIRQTPQQGCLLFLISGGASSLVEVLPPELTLAELIRVNEWLIGSGLPISDINGVRRALSCIKGGQLAGYLHGRRAHNLLMSDVPGNHCEIIGSGLLVPWNKSEIGSLDLPHWLQALLDRVPPRVPLPPAVFDAIDTRVIASVEDARQAAAAVARQMGYRVQLHRELIRGDVLATADQLAPLLIHGPAGVHVWGGETTVELPSQVGRGGRNQSLALALAQRIVGRHQMLFLAAGSDGNDGNSEDAGALVDGQTLRRGRQAGLAGEQCLAHADAGTFLAASGDLIHTGPTGTNVMDVVLGLKWSDP